MSLVESLVIFIVGLSAGVGIVFILQQERIFAAGNHLQRYAKSISDYIRERNELQSKIKIVKSDIHDLRQSLMQIKNERKVMELAWLKDESLLQSTKRVCVDEAIIFGRGREWVYLYTFPAHEQLAHHRQSKIFPMNLGMTTRANFVNRVDEQVAGNSTAISERAVVRLVFRVNFSREVEKWMHDYFKRNSRQVPGTVGVEWFNTIPLKFEQLFRSYVLQQIETIRPAAVTEFLSDEE